MVILKIYSNRIDHNSLKDLNFSKSRVTNCTQLGSCQNDLSQGIFANVSICGSFAFTHDFRISEQRLSMYTGVLTFREFELL